MAKTARPARKPAAASVDIGARRDAVVDAAMALAATRGWQGIALADIAAEAGLSLSELYEAFHGKGAILAYFGSRVDAKVLAGTGSDMAEESRHDRLFDVLMRRFDAAAPYRAGVRALLADARRDPSMALCAAPRLLLYLSVMRVWVDDESPDMSGTMAALDGRLRRAERFLGA